MCVASAFEVLHAAYQVEVSQKLLHRQTSTRICLRACVCLHVCAYGCVSVCACMRVMAPQSTVRAAPVLMVRWPKPSTAQCHPAAIMLLLHTCMLAHFCMSAHWRTLTRAHGHAWAFLRPGLTEVLLTGGIPPNIHQPLGCEAAYRSLYKRLLAVSVHAWAAREGMDLNTGWLRSLLLCNQLHLQHVLHASLLEICCVCSGIANACKDLTYFAISTTRALLQSFGTSIDQAVLEGAGTAGVMLLLMFPTSSELACGGCVLPWMPG